MTYNRQKPLSLLSKSSLICLKHSLKKNWPYDGKWLEFWNDFSKNDGDMMFMSWYGFILAKMTSLMPPLLICLFFIATLAQWEMKLRFSAYEQWWLGHAWNKTTPFDIWSIFEVNTFCIWNLMCWHVELWVGSLGRLSTYYIWIDIKLHE